MNSLFYSASRPRVSEVVASLFDLDRLSKADTDAQLLTLGAQLATGRFDEFALLVQQLDFRDISPDDRAYIANHIFSEFYESILANPETSSALAGAVLQLLVAFSPEAILAHKLKSVPPKQNTLIELDYEQNINSAVSGVVFFREFMFGPGTRKHEFGYRIQSALASQGWDVSLRPLQEIGHYSSPDRNDFALVDILAFAHMPPIDFIRNVLSNLKRSFRKIIIIEPDPWTGIFDEMLRSISDHVDYVWGFTADWSLLDEPSYRGKSVLFPNVGGLDHLDNLKLADLDWNGCTFNFTGSVQGYNLNRTYWILEAIRRDLPIEIKITKPGIDDGLDRDESLQLYAQSLASTHASLNMTTRKDGSQIITGRSAEVISLNRLLVQESCPAFHHYYVDGEHFLEFSGIEGLCTIIEFLRAHPRVAQRICLQGHRFYQEKYSCRKMVEHIQTLL